MNVIYIFDNNYADISGVSIYSLFASNIDIENITLYIIDGGISESNKNRLLDIGREFDRNIIFLPFSNPDDKFGITLDIDNWCKTNYIRLYLEDLLPNDVEKVIYIDSDTLIRSSLESLYEMNMKDKPIAAAYDCYPLPKYQLGFSKNDEYYSDGILLLDLKKLRELDTFTDYKVFLKERGGKVPYLEQGTINYVMKDKICLIPAKYNLMTLSIFFSSCTNIFFDKNEPFYDENEMIHAICNPAIVHLTGHSIYTRPWQEESNHPYANEWLETMKKTPWKDDFKFRKVNRRFINLYLVFSKFLNYLMKNKMIASTLAKYSKRMKTINSYKYKEIL